MTSVPPHRIRVPMLLGGPHAACHPAAARRARLRREVATVQLGVASATKMCRSVMIKGLEAMVVESLRRRARLRRRRCGAGVARETFPGIDWERQGTYFFQRVIAARPPPRRRDARGGGNRARNRARAVVGAGTAERQALIADLADAGAFGASGQRRAIRPQHATGASRPIASSRDWTKR